MDNYLALEKEYALLTNHKYGVSCNTGTAALHLVLAALGIGKGDEVIVPDFAFASVSFAVLYTGAAPVFVDCDETLNIDPSKIKITRKTKAIIAVHTYGNKCNMSAILKLGVPVIEDACEAQGVEVGGGVATCFSFQSNKIISAEEGGMVVTNNKALADSMRFMRNISNDGKYFHPCLGWNYRMPNLIAGEVLKKLVQFKSIIKERKEIEQKYIGVFGGLEHDTPWVFDMIVSRRELKELLYIEGVRPFFKPQSTFPMFNKEPGKNALKFSRTGFIVNLNPKLNHDKIIKEICNVLNT